jgi:uncharacterized protein (DUF58 family)
MSARITGLGRDLLRFKLTDPGKLLAVGTLFALTGGSLTLAAPLYYIFTSLIALLLISLVLGMIYWPRVSVSGGFPDKAVAGQPVTGRFTLFNRSRFNVHDVSLDYFELPVTLERLEHAESVPRLGPGESATVRLVLQPRRRGLYRLNGMRYFTTFPFNLFRTGPRVDRGETLAVLPNFHPLSGVHVSMGSRYQPGGIALTSNVGESPEFVGNRDYRPGDPLRRIDPRAWGRLGAPIVKEYQEEYYCRIALVLDTHVSRTRMRGPGGFVDLEAAVSLTAAIGEAMSNGEYVIDLFAAGPDLYVLRSGRHTANFDNVLEILAGVRECRDDPFGKVTPAMERELSQISAVVFVMLGWSESRRQLVRSAVEAGCSVKLVFVGHRGMDRYDGVEGVGDSVVQLSPRTILSGGVDRL